MARIVKMTILKPKHNIEIEICKSKRVKYFPTHFFSTADSDEVKAKLIKFWEVPNILEIPFRPELIVRPNRQSHKSIKPGNILLNQFLKKFLGDAL